MGSLFYPHNISNERSHQLSKHFVKQWRTFQASFSYRYSVYPFWCFYCRTWQLCPSLRASDWVTLMLTGDKRRFHLARYSLSSCLWQVSQQYQHNILCFFFLVVACHPWTRVCHVFQSCRFLRFCHSIWCLRVLISPSNISTLTSLLLHNSVNSDCNFSNIFRNLSW